MVPTDGLALAVAAEDDGLMANSAFSISHVSHIAGILTRVLNYRLSRAPSAAPAENLALAEAAEDDGLMADVVAMTGGAVGQDAIARLEVTLRVATVSTY